MHYHELFSVDIENNFNRNGELRISSKIDYKYNNLKYDITRLCHEYQLYTKDGLIHTLVYNDIDFSVPDYTNNILYVKEYFYITLHDDYSKVKIILMLHRVNRKGTGSIALETYNNNFIDISFIDNPIK